MLIRAIKWLHARSFVLMIGRKNTIFVQAQLFWRSDSDLGKNTVNVALSLLSLVKDYNDNIMGHFCFDRVRFLSGVISWFRKIYPWRDTKFGHDRNIQKNLTTIRGLTLFLLERRNPDWLWRILEKRPAKSERNMCNDSCKYELRPEKEKTRPANSRVFRLLGRLNSPLAGQK